VKTTYKNVSYDKTINDFNSMDVIENVMAFAWEPTGNRFAFIHGESPRICVSFYTIRQTGKVELISKYMYI
jgi:translation initiation factor 3 subunit B